MSIETEHQRVDKSARVLLDQIQRAPCRRMLSGLPTFRVENDTPRHISDLLHRLDAAESRAAPKSC